MAVSENIKESTTTRTLSVSNVEVVYNSVILVLRGITLEVAPGVVVSLLGPNGAGKSTTLKAISGLLKAELGEVTRGQILWGDEGLDGLAAEDVVRMGLVQVIEGRLLFRHLTVEENLRIGGMVYQGGRHIREDLERVYHYFPQLAKLSRPGERLPLRRRGADAGDRARDDGASADPDAGRAVVGIGADAGARDL